MKNPLAIAIALLALVTCKVAFAETPVAPTKEAGAIANAKPVKRRRSSTSSASRAGCAPSNRAPATSGSARCDAGAGGPAVKAPPRSW